ncbi:MAG: ubiquinol-cytochrome c reductase iron-sulfur subunit [Alphaproteobacteria bacterium]
MTDHPKDETPTRRDFILLTGVAMTTLGAAIATWPLIDSFNPSAEVLALATTELNLADIEPGQAVTIIWRGKPVFVRHRTPEEIQQANAVNLNDLPDPQPDAERATNPQWLVLVGICTHLGCIPLGQKDGDSRGDFNGWFCPCHGSHYDLSGRIRKGPAPKNLAVPQYRFINDTRIIIG